jgi:Putative adhesin
MNVGMASSIIYLLLATATADAQTKVNRGLPLDATGAVRVYNLVGSVRITGWKNDSVAVRGTLPKGGVLHMVGGRGGIKMFVEGADERNPGSANIEVMVPIRAKVWVKTATASIDVSGVSGSLDLYVVGGDITVKGNPADVNAEAIDGSITISGSPAWVRAKSASGSVSINGSSSDMTCSTVSGKIDVNGTKFEKAKFESVTGSIRFAGSFERGGLVNFDTHSGSIEIGMPAGSPADLDVVSIAGSIVNKLTSSKPLPGRYGRGSELSTSSGEGGTRVVVRSFKGPVVLLRKD